MNRIVLVCHFSTEELRSHLPLKNLNIEKKLRHILGATSLSYSDLAPWIPAFIRSFEKHSEYEFHVVSHHYGLKKELVTFSQGNIHYHIIRQERGMFFRVLDRFFHYDKKNDYLHNRKRISRIIDSVKPQLMVICGIENPFYSAVALNDNNPPLLLILQTLLNSSKRIEMGVGDEYRRELETRIIKKATSVACCDNESSGFVRKNAPQARIFDFTFPTNDPEISCVQKEKTFVFFARGIEKFKGIEDVLKAFSIVQKRHPESSLEIIGDCRPDYKMVLDEMMGELKIKDSVSYYPFFPSHNDALFQVQRAYAAVLPGITAPLNGTVREAMLLGLPTIVYRNSVIDDINGNEEKIFAAVMEDVKDLANKMSYVIENMRKAQEVAANGKKYAETHFTSSSAGERLVSIIRESIC